MEEEILLVLVEVQEEAEVEPKYLHVQMQQKYCYFNPQLLSNSPGGFLMGGRGSPGGGGMPRGYGLIPPPITNGSIPWSYGQLSPRIQNPLSAGNVDTYHSHITTTFCCMALLLTIVVFASLPLLWLLGLDVSSPSLS